MKLVLVRWLDSGVDVMRLLPQKKRGIVPNVP